MKRRKPHDPGSAETARQDRLAREAEARRMEAQGATVTKDKRTGAILSAFRSNVFNSLLRAGAISQNQHDAAATLAKDWAIWKGLDGGGEIDVTSPVDCASQVKSLVSDRMLSARMRVLEALNDVGRADRALLEALIRETVEDDRPRPWRLTVQQLTGETREKEQREKVVCALENLRMFYEAPRRAA